MRGTPTVVSAFYPIPSKFSVEIYLKWIEQFWPSMPCNVVWFTQPELEGMFRAMFQAKLADGTLRLCLVPFEELAAFRRLEPWRWVVAAERDREGGHSPELYALWFEKKEFVCRAMVENPFESEEFVWCDAGICRDARWAEMVREFPRADRIPRGRMLVLQIDPFADGDGAETDFGTRATVGGGILASDRAGWKAWYEAYDAMLMRYIRDGRFYGKDQNLMASMILDRPELVRLVAPSADMNPVTKWFTLLFYLGGA